MIRQFDSSMQGFRATKSTTDDASAVVQEFNLSMSDFRASKSTIKDMRM